MLVLQNITVDAAPETAWRVLSDVEHWPDVTGSVTSVEHLAEERLGVDSRVRVRRPGQRPAVYTVITYDAGRTFAWTARRLGVETLAAHAVTPRPDGRSTLTLTFQLEGFLAPLVRLVARARIERHVATAAADFKRRAEELDQRVPRPAGRPR